MNNEPTTPTKEKIETALDELSYLIDKAKTNLANETTLQAKEHGHPIPTHRQGFYEGLISAYTFAWEEVLKIKHAEEHEHGRV